MALEPADQGRESPYLGRLRRKLVVGRAAGDPGAGNRRGGRPSCSSTAEEREAKGATVTERFVGERIRPVAGTVDTLPLAVGEPGLPRRFLWREGTVEVARLRRVWRETGPCRHGSGERYVRRHWFEVVAVSGDVLTLYFERQARRGEGRGSRWWLFRIRRAGEDSSGAPGG